MKNENSTRPLLLIDCMYAYVQHLKKDQVGCSNLKARSQQNVIRHLKCFVRALNACQMDLLKMELTDVDNLLIGKAFDYLINVRKLSTKTINIIFYSLKKCIDFVIMTYNLKFQNPFMPE